IKQPERYRRQHEEVDCRDAIDMIGQKGYEGTLARDLPRRATPPVGTRPARQAPATDAPTLRTAVCLHRPSGWQGVGILPPAHGILQSHQGTDSRASDSLAPMRMDSRGQRTHP